MALWLSKIKPFSRKRVHVEHKLSILDLGDFIAKGRGKYTELCEYATKMSEMKIQSVS